MLSAGVPAGLADPGGPPAVAPAPEAEPAALSLTIDRDFLYEDDAPALGSVARDPTADLTQPLLVSLASSHPLVSVPSQVDIPAGETSIDFPVTPATTVNTPGPKASPSAPQPLAAPNTTICHSPSTTPPTSGLIRRSGIAGG